MKKFGKFMLAALSLAALAGGAFYFVKNVLNKDSNDDFDDFDDDFDDFDSEEEDAEEENNSSAEKREYVTININDASTVSPAPETEETTEDEPVSEPENEEENKDEE